ncbi:MAG: glycosyltransferase [Acidobacteriota bacterium]
MARLSIVVPTAGKSPYLESCLRQLRGDAAGAELILAVAPGVPIEATVAEAAGLCDRVLEVPAGFAAANNAAFAAAEGDYLATVNDDALIEPGWSSALTAFLDRRPGVAAVQGLVLQHDPARQGPERLDGAGIGWNAWLQAVQIGRDAGTPARFKTPRPIFGVSATAAVYRRAALEKLPGGLASAFDPRLFAYYEDVDLALRLRAAGHQAWLVPEARVQHAGSATGRGLPFGGRALIHGNRHLVLASRLAGGDYLIRLPRLLARDLLDAAHHLRRGEARAALGVLAGLARAARRVPARLWARGEERIPAASLIPLSSPHPSTLEQLRR